MESRHVRQRYFADHIGLDDEKSLVEKMGCQLQTSSRSERDSFRLDNVGYSDSEVGAIADVPHYLIFQVSWDYDEILETIPGQVRQDVMDYRVRTQREHRFGPRKRERT